MDFTAIDFETANRDMASACSIGLVKVSGGVAVDAASWLIRPKRMYFDPFFVSIHGIRPCDVEDQPEFDGLWEDIKGYIGGDILIAHNASFDMTVLRQLFKLYGITPPQYRYNCSCSIARRVWKGLPNYRLNTVADFLGLSFRHHDAREDAYASATIVIEAGKKFKADSVERLCGRLRLPLCTL